MYSSFEDSTQTVMEIPKGQQDQIARPALRKLDRNGLLSHLCLLLSTPLAVTLSMCSGNVTYGAPSTGVQR